MALPARSGELVPIAYAPARRLNFEEVIKEPAPIAYAPASNFAQSSYLNEQVPIAPTRNSAITGAKLSMFPPAPAPATLAPQDFPQPAHAGFLASGAPFPATPPDPLLLVGGETSAFPKKKKAGHQVGRKLMEIILSSAEKWFK